MFEFTPARPVHRQAPARLGPVALPALRLAFCAGLALVAGCGESGSAAPPAATLATAARNLDGAISGSTAAGPGAGTGVAHPAAAARTPKAVTVSPSAPTVVGSGGHLTFSSTLAGATWSVDGIPGGNAAVGTISASGVYTCPAVTAQALHTVTATWAARPAVSASVTLLATASNTTVNARTQFGATGDGSTDDTAAINKALAATGKGICHLPGGANHTYLINASANGIHGLMIPAGATLLMDPDVTLKCIPQTRSDNYMVIEMMASNVAVVGGTIIGDRAARNLPTFEDGVGTDFEFGYGIGIYGDSHAGAFTNNILLGVTSRDNACDGFFASNCSNHLQMVGCTADNNRRQGLSLCWVINATIRDCTFRNTNGQDPGFGLDIEPDYTGKVATNIQISGCTLTGNQGGGLRIGVFNGTISNVDVTGNTITGNGGHNYGYGGIVAIAWPTGPTSHVTITNNTVTGNRAGAISGGIVLINTSHMTVTRNVVADNAGYGLSFTNCSPGTTFAGNTASGNTSGAIHNDGSATAN